MNPWIIGDAGLANRAREGLGLAGAWNHRQHELEVEIIGQLGFVRAPGILYVRIMPSLRLMDRGT